MKLHKINRDVTKITWKSKRRQKLLNLTKNHCKIKVVKSGKKSRFHTRKMWAFCWTKIYFKKIKRRRRDWARRGAEPSGVSLKTDRGPCRRQLRSYPPEKLPPPGVEGFVATNESTPLPHRSSAVAHYPANPFTNARTHAHTDTRTLAHTDA